MRVLRTAEHLLLVLFICIATRAVAGTKGIELQQSVTDLNTSALQYERQGDYNSATILLEQARALWLPSSNLLPGMHSALLANLADAYEHCSRWAEALSVLAEAVALNETAYGPADARTLEMQVRLGQAEVVIGDFASADARLHSALELERRTAGADKTELAVALSAVAILDLNLNRLEEAERLAVEGAAIAQTMDPESTEYGSMIGVLASVYLRERNNARALPLLTRSIAILQAHASDTVRMAPLLVQRGVIEAADHKYTLAEGDVRRAIELLDGGGAPSFNADWARLHLARLYVAEGRLAEADAIVPAAVQRQRSYLRAPGRRLALCISELAHLRTAQKRYPEAHALYREAIGMLSGDSRVIGEAHAGAGEKQVRALERVAAQLLGGVGVD